MIWLNVAVKNRQHLTLLGGDVLGYKFTNVTCSVLINTSDHNIGFNRNHTNVTEDKSPKVNNQWY